MLNRILLAYDGSQPAERAFEFALELAQAFHAPLIVLSVARPSEPPTMVETEAILEAATEHFEKDFERLRSHARETGVVFEARVVVGHPADQIIHAASQEKADMIVMGHRGKSLIQRWLLGSISKRVVSYAHCTVTIVR
ncbi:MAG: universal stress protein [Candidatus Sumerlaeota bacterium]|nr:universal stress protein [Candidatus Sumerlaeota bacterium]